MTDAWANRALKIVTGILLALAATCGLIIWRGLAALSLLPGQSAGPVREGSVVFSPVFLLGTQIAACAAFLLLAWRIDQKRRRRYGDET